MRPRRYYQPTRHGSEAEIGERLERLSAGRKGRANRPD